MSNTDKSKERAKEYRQRLKARGGRTLTLYLEPENNDYLQKLTAEYQTTQNNIVNMALELFYRATFEPDPDQATDSSTEQTQKQSQTQQEQNDEVTLEDVKQSLSYNKDGKPLLPTELLYLWASQQRYKHNRNYSHICTDLNKAGIPTQRGKDWKTGTLEGFLRRNEK